MKKIRFFIKNSRNPNTNKNYNSKVNCFIKFCKSIKLEPFPLNSAALILFLLSLTNENKGSQANNYLNAIIKFATDEGFSGEIEKFVFRLASGIKRFANLSIDKSKNERQRFEVSSLENYILNYENDNEFIFLRDSTLVALGLRIFGRANELCNLKINNISFDSSGIMNVFIARSKTDQDSNGRRIPIEPATDDQFICPVILMKNYLKMIKSFSLH